MRRLLMMSAVMGLAGGAALADPAEGMWRTEPGDTGGYLHVEVSKCGDALCGVIKQAFDGSGETAADYEHVGKRMLWGMRPSGGGNYGKGKIWAPDRDKTYNSKMSLEGDRMEVSGCVLVVCRGQTWVRLQ